MKKMILIALVTLGQFAFAAPGGRMHLEKAKESYKTSKVYEAVKGKDITDAKVITSVRAEIMKAGLAEHANALVKFLQIDPVGGSIEIARLQSILNSKDANMAGPIAEAKLTLKILSASETGLHLLAEPGKTTTAKEIQSIFEASAKLASIESVQKEYVGKMIAKLREGKSLEEAHQAAKPANSEKTLKDVLDCV